MNEFCIIGAGISGVTLAKQLSDSVILEKSRGIGGRIAARRLGSFSINHGPEKINPAIMDPHGWIKHEAEGLRIHKSWEVSLLEIHADKIKVISLNDQFIECRKLILTVPAPQAHSILERSQISANFLTDVRYKKSIQFMLLTDEKTKTDELEKYVMRKSYKSLAENLSMALYEFKEQFIEEFFEKDKEEIKQFCSSKIVGNILDCHAHKWRYSEVLSPIDPKFQTVFKDKNIFLAGDYFGAHGIESSLESIKNVLPVLQKELK